MRCLILSLLIALVACNNNEHIKTKAKVDTAKTFPETLQVKKEAKPEVPLPKTYSNKRFKDVTVERVGQDTFLVRGQGQIFEANFNWVVEDGREELKKGFQMTDAGAPEWGKFEFTIPVHKKRENSTLTLILFESSPKDGSRQYELPITLY
jgi:Immunoglobulin-like domain of bacterial spore germination